MMKYSMAACALVAATSCAAGASASGPEDVCAFFRDGQTFLTWNECGAESYRVYRHTAPITGASLRDAEAIATVSAGSSRWQEMFQKKGDALLSSSRHKDTGWIVPRLVVEVDRSTRGSSRTRR